MNNEDLKLKLSQILLDLENSGDIILTTSTPNMLVERIVRTIENYKINSINEEEFIAIQNSLNVLIHGIQLDDRDFQTIIGIEKTDLKNVLNKLSKIRNKDV